MGARRLAPLLVLLPTLLSAPARAFVVGKPPSPLSTHILFGNAKATGASLMLPGPAGAEIRSVLLANAASAFGDLPPDAVIEKAYLFWSGSLAQDGVTGPKSADSSLTFIVATGTSYTVTAPPGACTTVVHPTLGTTFPPFYYCRAEVTAQVAANKLGGSYNGQYIVGGVAADPGHVNLTGQCTEAPYSRCQAKYAAWSLVLVYSSPSETLQRDIHLYDGFLVVDHEDGPTGSLGVTSFPIGNFLADATPQATLSYFAVETDYQLGQPPQDQYPPGSPFYCDACQDYVKLNGTTLTDERGWPGNIMNESMGVGAGVDIDVIEVGQLLSPGSTQATVEIGSGTGPVVNPAPASGGGELFGFGWTLLSLRRPAPNFKTSGTYKSVNPTQAGQGETLAYTVNILNAGSLAATNTVVRDTLPALVGYKPGSLQLGGVPCTDAADGDPCTVSGQTLTVNLGTVSNLPPGNSRQITLLATVSPSALNGQSVCNQAQVVSDQTPTPFSTPPSCFTVKAPDLGTPTKVVADLNGGVTAPEDILQFTVTIPAKTTGPISGISLLDDIPPYLQLLTVIPPAGATNGSTLNGGAFGRGQVKVSNISIPTGASAVTVTFLAQIDSEAKLGAQGVPPSAIDGLSICNQGSVSAAFLPQSLLTDDPAAPGAADSTCLKLTYAPKLGTSSKSVLDLSGGKLEPGDTLRYTLSFNNTGNRPATLTVADDLPPQVTGFVLLGAVPGAAFLPPPAGASGTGRLTVSNLSLPAGGSVSLQFEVAVASTALNGTVLQNCMSFTVAEKASEGATLCAPPLTVYATPNLESTKTVLDLSGGQVRPGDVLRYTLTTSNAGNRPATGVAITDVVSAGFTDVVPLDGGTYDGATRTVTWMLGSLAQGASATVRFEAKIVAPTANGTVLCNQATVASIELPGVPTDNPATPAKGDPTCVTVVSAPDFSAATKTVLDLNGPPTRPGDKLRYTIEVKNDGTDTATSVLVQDKVSTSLTAVVPLDGGAYNPATRTLTWTLPSLVPGQAQSLHFEATVVTPLVNGTEISNQAFVSATQIPLPGTPTDDPGTPALDDPTVVTVTSAANLSLTEKTVLDVNGGVPQPGDPLTYTIRLRNTGDAPARSALVTDVVSPSLTSIVPLEGGAYSAASRTITWPGADVVPGTDRVVHFTASVLFPLPNGTQVCNQGTVTSQDLPLPVFTDDPATPAPSDATCVVVESKPDLGPSVKTVEDLNGGAVEPGDTLRYSIKVDNIGTQDATAVVVKDAVSPLLTSIVPLDGGTFDGATRTLTWSIPLVGAKSSATVRFLAQVVSPLDNGVPIANQASITAAQIPTPVLSDDPKTPAAHDPTVVTVSAAPSFKTSTKALTDLNGGKVEPGDSLRYTLTVVNSGTSVADQVVVTDTLDPSLDFVSADQGGAYSAANRTITWNSGTTPALLKVGLGPAATVTFTLVAKVKSPLKNGTQICNQGLLGSEELAVPEKTDNPQTPVAGDATCATVSSAPDLSGAAKTVADGSGAPVRPGDVLTYTITLPNTGNSPATGVTVADVVDASLEAVVPGQGGTYNPVSRTITWTPAGTPALASIAAQSSATLSFTAAVKKPLDNGTKVSNQAKVQSADLPLPVLTDDPSTTILDDPTVVTVVSAPALGGSQKTVTDGNGGDVEPGDTLTWTITLRNTGDAVAKAVVVTDGVDPSLTNIAALDGGVYSALTRTLTWNVPQVGLTPAGDVKLRFTAKVVTPLKNGTLIKNQGSVKSGSSTTLTDDPQTAAPGDPTVVTVVSKPNLSDMAKSVSPLLPGRKVAPGTALTYTIVVPNTGNDDAQNTVVKDVVDQDLESVVPLDGGTYDGATRTLTWVVPLIKVGSQVTLRFTAQVRADAKNGAEVANQAFAEVPGYRAKIPSDDPSTPAPHDPTVLIVEAIPRLEQFTKTVKDLNGGDSVPGDVLEYTLVVRNTGAAYAFDVTVTDSVQTKDLTNVVPGQGGVLTSGIITWKPSSTPALAKVAPGAEVTLSFTATIRVPTENGTSISNQAVLQAAGVSAEPSDDPTTPADNDPTVVKVVSLPNLQGSEKRVTDLNGGLVKPGDTLEYAIRVVNSGTANTTDATLVDAIPTYTTYVAGSTLLNGAHVADPTGATASPTATGLLLSSPGEPPGRLLVGQGNAAEVRFRVRVRLETQEGVVVSNQGLVRSAETPLTVTDDPATPLKGDPTQVVVGSGPNLSGTRKIHAEKPIGDNGNGKFEVGEVIAYLVTIPNSGTGKATGVIFSDPLDPSHGAYVPGSLTLNGTPLTDASDSDQGSVSGSNLRVVVGTIEAGQTALVGYQVRVVAGPRVVNQGLVRSTELQPELTDADGNDTNGDSATVVPVAGGSSRSLRGQKTVLDVNGGDVRPGDELLYTITVFNDGSADENVDVIDHLPDHTRYVATSLVAPPGVTSAFDAPPQGGFARGRARVAGMRVKAGDSATVLLRVTLDTDVSLGSSVCNTAQLGGAGGLDLQTPLDAGCVLVGSPAGTGGLSGAVFRDLGEDNQVLDGKDQRLPGFQVQAYLFGNPNGTPVAAAVTDEKGLFRMGSLPPGPYTLRVLTSRGTQMGTLGALQVPAGKALSRDVPVDPSGIVYDSVTGNPVAEAQVYLHYDATDTGAPGALVPTDLLGPGQQGQTTDGSGFYRFDLQRGRRYEIRVRPLSSSLQFPSSLIPVTPGFAVTGPEHEVVPDDLPDPKREGAKLTYYLRLKVDSAEDEVFNNHLPVDPLSALIRLEKRSDRRRASLGDVVTYTVTVENRSTREFLAPASQAGIEDLLPQGLRLLLGSARKIRRPRAGNLCLSPETSVKDVDGVAACLAMGEPTRVTGRVLHFGPFPLGAGESVRLVYQVAVGLDTRQGIYQNRAVLRDAGFASDLSNTGQATILVEPDPDLDQGILLGKVFCDPNRDGKQGQGERGVAGARVYLDNGTYAVTDATGKYHLRNIDPGLRLLKIDVNTLAPGSRLTTDESRVVQFTRGLPAKVSFGVLCQENWVGVQRVDLRPPPKKAESKPARKLVVPGLSLAGDVPALRVSVDGRVVPTPEVDLALAEAKRAPPFGTSWEDLPVVRLRRDAAGRLAPGLVLHLRARGPLLRGWHLTVWKVGTLAGGVRREVVRRFSGAGATPAQILWDGRLAGKPVLEEGSLYQAQLEAISVTGEGATSPYRRFAVGWGQRPVPSRPAAPPAALLDGTPLALDARHRFATTVGRVSARPPILELRRGDGKGTWLSLGGAQEPTEDDSLERLKVSGNLTVPSLEVDGRPVDASLLMVRLEADHEGALPAVSPSGKLAEAAELRGSFPPLLLRRWTLRIVDAAGRAQRTLSGLGKPPAALLWNGTTDQGEPMVEPGASYVAQLSLEDAQGNLGQSSRVVLTAPAAPKLAPLKLRAAPLFDAQRGILVGLPRQKLADVLRAIKRRPASERYRVVVRVAPPVTWEPDRWTGLLRIVEDGLRKLLLTHGLKPERYELSVNAQPLPAAPTVPAGRRSARGARPGQETLELEPLSPPPLTVTPEAPRVVVDGEPLPVKADGTFGAWAKVNLGSALIIELRDGSGRRALLVHPTKPRTKIRNPQIRAVPLSSLSGTKVGSTGSQPAGGTAGLLTLRMRDGRGEATRLAQAAPTPRPAPTPSAPEAFGAQVLHQAFGAPAGAAKSAPLPTRRNVPAAQLRVDLPPQGVVLKTQELAVRGRTLPRNKVTINGTEVTLGEDGSFTQLVKLPLGKSELVIRAVDQEGNQGTIRWPVEVSRRALFLMAMAEGAIGQVGAELDGATDATRLASGPVMLQGRVVLYLKGRIQGKHLFQQYFVTAHLDTAKQREFGEFFDQVIDPNRFYPIYGDSALEVRDVNARDKYYVLVEADRSSLLVGNFNAGVKGLELLRYDRMLYGVKVDFDREFFGGKLRQQAKAFVSRDDAHLSRDHNVLRATGGSIYYLRHGEVLVGSERLNLVVRERSTGILLSSIPRSRDVDYVIDYPGGRILFKSPVSSVADAGFSVQNPTFSLSTLAGNPVYIEVDYEYDSTTQQGSGGWGVQVKDTLFEVLTVGGTYVEENRSAEAGASYRLYGGELTLRHGKASSVTAEFARSESYDAQNFLSEDGGITYLALNQVALLSGDPRASEANAYKLTATMEVSDFVKRVKSEALKVQGYLSQLDRGFFSDGTILEQGRTKFGGAVEWTLRPEDKLSLRHDGAIALLPQIPLPGSTLDPLAFREVETELTRLRYEMRRGRLGLQAEYAHSFLRDGLVAGADSHRDAVGVLGTYRLSKRLRLILGQDAILYRSGNDPQLGSGALGMGVASTGDWRDRLMTTVGAALSLTKSLELEVAESVRWSGDNATSVGLKTKMSETASLYVRQVLNSVDEHLSTTSVVGAEDRFGRGGAGRTYGEYQIESGISGVQNRAILGLSQTWAPWRGISFAGGFEHQQVFGGHLPDGTPTGDNQRDVAHLGFEYTRLKRLKLSSRAELRYDNGSGVIGLSPTGTSSTVLAPNVDTRPGFGSGSYADRLVTPGSQLLLSPGERWQVVTRNAASLAATRDITLLARMNLYRTYNRTEGRLEAQALELGVGAALRPVEWDWLNVLLKYTRLLEMRPLSLTENLARSRIVDILSLATILDLPFRFQLVEKLAYKRVEEDQDLLPGQSLHSVVHTLLWINRLNFHLTGRLDAGLEYRFLRLILADQGDQLKHGALVELGYWVHEFVRLGAGYNFSRFSDNEFADQDRDASGFFFRVVGKY